VREQGDRQKGGAKLPNVESELQMLRHFEAAGRIARRFIGRRLHCPSSGDGLHGPFDFDLKARTATCRVCRRSVDAYDFMVDIEINSACWGDNFNRHRIVGVAKDHR
jgi:hypothetical protein